MPDPSPDHGLPVAVLRLDRGLPLPAYAHPGEAGADLTTVDVTLASGEIKMLLVNHDLTEPVEMRRGHRIAQLVFRRVERAVLTEVDALLESVRGIGGYGATGGSAGLSVSLDVTAP